MKCRGRAPGVLAETGMARAGRPGGAALSSTTEFRWYNDAGNQRAALVSYLRWDANDVEHSLADLREAFWAFEGDDSENKLGQPMVSLMLQRDWGEITAFLVPYFRERTFAGEAGRLSPRPPVDTDNAMYGLSDAKRHVDLALRYSHYIGDIDIGLNVFSGTSREPRLLPGTKSDSGTSISVWKETHRKAEALLGATAMAL